MSLLLFREAVPHVLEEAATKGAAGAVVLSAGFRDAGRLDLEHEIVRVARSGGMRLMGPNMQGFCYLPNNLCAVFWPVLNKLGPVAVVGQSGTVTAAVAGWAREEGLGLSAMINLGNQADISESDILEFLLRDGHTRSVALYLEAPKDGRGFLRAAGRVAHDVPIAVLKGGVSPAGLASAASHTGSLAGNNRVFAAACRQFGLAQVDDAESLYDAAKAFATLGRPRGERLFIVSSSGGAATLAVDAAYHCGVKMQPISPELKRDLGSLGLPPNSSMANPLDLAGIDPDAFLEASRLAASHDAVDLLLLAFGDPIVGAADVVRSLSEELQGRIAVVSFGGGEVGDAERALITAQGVPVFPTPERAVRAIGSVFWAASHRRNGCGE